MSVYRQGKPPAGQIERDIPRMAKLLLTFRENPSVSNAQKVLGYARKHPMAACMLDREQTEWLANAQVVVSNG